jgi:hypothetical protein
MYDIPSCALGNAVFGIRDYGTTLCDSESIVSKESRHPLGFFVVAFGNHDKT